MKVGHFDRIKEKMLSAKIKGEGIVEWEKKCREKAAFTSMSFRWNWFRAAFSQEERRGLFNELSQYLNDDPIDTALRKIVGDKLKGT
jgi:hypothetical protein